MTRGCVVSLCWKLRSRKGTEHGITPRIGAFEANEWPEGAFDSMLSTAAQE